jgi:hypothetical protein
MKTPQFIITNTNLLTLFKGIIAVYTENHKKTSIQIAESVNDKVGGTYRYYTALKGQTC